MKSEKKGKMVLLPISLLCFLFLFACAHRTVVEQVSMDELRGNLKYENIIFEEFKATQNVVSPEAALAQSQASAISYLKGKNIFNIVEKKNDKTYDRSTLLVEATLTDLRIVSGSARFWGGAFAGRSHMKMDVKLIDANNGSLVVEKELVGIPGSLGGAWSIGASDRGLPANMGKLLGNFILANVSKN